MKSIQNKIRETFISNLKFDLNQTVYVLFIDNRPVGFIPSREGFTYNEYELINSVRNEILNKLYSILDHIKKIGQSRPKTKKPESSISNKELQIILTNVPNEQKAEVARLINLGRKNDLRSNQSSDDEFFDFGMKLLKKVDQFIEQNNLSQFVDCFSLCGMSYNNLFHNNEAKLAFVGKRIGNSKGNFYADLAGSFQVKNDLNHHFQNGDVKIYQIPMILNKELFE